MIEKNKTQIIFLFMLLFYLLMGLNGIFRMSLTFDELAHIPAGYTYLTENDYRMNFQDHPPLAKMIAALPLLFFKLLTFKEHRFWRLGYQWQYGDLFLYHNLVKPYILIHSARIILLCLSALLGYIIFLWSRNLGNELAGLIGAGLFYFSPAFIGHSSLVTTDVPMALCYFLTIFSFWKLYEEIKISNAIMLGLGMGCTLGVKFSGILIIPVLAFLLFSCLLVGDKKIPWQEVLIYAGIIFFFATFTLAAIYRFVHIASYLAGMKYLLTQVGLGRSSFLLGKYSASGWWCYFPITFLLKTPMGTILLCLVGLGLLPKLCYSNRGRLALLFLTIPATVFLFAAIRSPMQIGHRHILPIYPFLFTWLGWVSVHFQARLKVLPVICLSTTLISVLYAQPYNLEYFNILIGSKNNASNYLIDSNLDWGQGLKELGKYLQGIDDKQVFLSYFGTADPHYEDIKYIPVLFYSTVHRKVDYPSSLKGKKILFAISATQKKCLYYASKDIFQWLNGLKPIGIIAYSIFVYDLTASKTGLQHLQRILRNTGEQKAVALLEDILKSE
ncbi:glycosyltransferase family 39 protein [Candidatus Riflebacteria bacterium]